MERHSHHGRCIKDSKRRVKYELDMGLPLSTASSNRRRAFSRISNGYKDASHRRDNNAEPHL